MGKLGRFACIFTPMALTIVSLVSLIIVGTGNTNKSSSVSNSLYFFRANTSDIKLNASIIDLPSNPLTDALTNAAAEAIVGDSGLYDFYHIGLWNYCAGSFGDNSTGSKNVEHVQYCSPKKTAFWFDPVSVWGIPQVVADNFFDKSLKDGLSAYKQTAKWMFAAYVIAIASVAVEILVGFTALFSRLGSVATTFVSLFSSFFTFAFALTATILYAALEGAFNDALKQYHIHGNLNRTIYIWAWLAVAFSWAAGIFWTFSSCCCSGRSDRIKGYSDRRGRNDYNANYKMMPESKAGYQQPFAHHAEGYNPQQNGITGGNATAYEPYRQAV